MKAKYHPSGEWTLDGTAEEVAKAIRLVTMTAALYDGNQVRLIVKSKPEPPKCEDCRYCQPAFPTAQCTYNTPPVQCWLAREEEKACGASGKFFDPNKAEAV